MRTLTLMALALALTAGCDDTSSPTDDGPLTDAAVGSDMSSADGAAGDGAVPDGAVPDGAVPDGAPDNAATDAGLDADLGATASLRINEIVTSRFDDGEDWIELFHTGAAGDPSVELSDYTLVDDDAEHTPTALPAGTLAAGEYRVFEAAGGDAIEGALPFKLGKDDSLFLRRGDALVEEISWTDDDVSKGRSYGRQPGADDTWGLLRPTPGAENLAAPWPLNTLFPKDRVTTVHVDLAPADWQSMLSDPLAEEYKPAYLTFDGIEVPDVQIRTKGFSSLRRVSDDEESIRYSFKIDLDRTVDQSLFGKRKFVLNNGFSDPSMLREHTAFAMMREFGLPAPVSAFVDLWIADEHMGLYTLIEVVDGDFLEDRFPELPDGDLYKPERPAGDLQDMGDAITDYVNLEPKRNEDTTDHAAFMGLIAALHRGAHLDTALDTEEALRYVAANVALLNLDSYLGMSHNYYLYEQAGVFQVLPWDTNMAFGSFMCGCEPRELIDFLIDEPTCGAIQGRPLIKRLLEAPVRMTRYHDLLRAFLDGPMAAAAIEARVVDAANLIRPYVLADDMLFFSVEAFEAAVAVDPSLPPQSGNVLNLVSRRAEAIRGQLSGAQPSTNEGAGNCGDDGPGEHHPCGNGVCEPTERDRPLLCPRDCEVRPDDYVWCGNGHCDAYEGATHSCPEDCQ